MAVVITLTFSAFIIMTILFIRSKFKIQRTLQTATLKENVPIYDDIDLSGIIDPKKNVAYDASSQSLTHHVQTQQVKIIPEN